MGHTGGAGYGGCAVKQFVIEHNIPLVAKNHRFGGGFQGAVRKLKVGDSIFVPGGVQSIVSATGRNVARETEARFTTRKTEGGVRIWRIS